MFKIQLYQMSIDLCFLFNDMYRWFFPFNKYKDVVLATRILKLIQETACKSMSYRRIGYFLIWSRSKMSLASFVKDTYSNT